MRKHVTFLCEVESIVNSRPLTPVSDDPNDYEALTPNHFILIKQHNNLPLGDFDENDLASRKKWRKVQAAIEIYWRRFIKEYIPSLNIRKRWSREDPSANIKTGDLVLMVDDNASRGNWPLARVTKLYPGRDNVVRTVSLKTTKGFLIRPVRRLCLLENIRGI